MSKEMSNTENAENMWTTPVVSKDYTRPAAPESPRNLLDCKLLSS